MNEKPIFIIANIKEGEILDIMVYPMTPNRVIQVHDYEEALKFIEASKKIEHHKDKNYRVLRVYILPLPKNES